MRSPFVSLHATELLRRAVLNLEVGSQLHARRNAQVAASAMARRRAEWNEVAELLAHRAPEITVTGAVTRSAKTGITRSA